MTKFSTGSFIAGCVLGILGAGVWFSSGQDVLATLSLRHAGTATTTTKTTTPDSGAASVNDQPSGDTVTVASVTVPPPGVWVAVREVNGTDLGNVLGAARVTGPRSDIVVPLLRATEPGLTYAVELYRDDGNDSFDLSNDSVYIDFSTGQPVTVYFTTTN